jgi:4'-phosphopantetheinyl transferase
MRSVNPTKTPVAERCEVHIAQLSMFRPMHRMLLDHTEQLRSAEYRFNVDRTRFELGAALLRLTVGRIVGRSGAVIRVDRTCELCGRPHGRPRVDEFDGHLSVSHSGNVVAVAITAAGPVGLDVEAIDGRTDIECHGIADLVLTASERSLVDSRTSFLRVWARKEAFLKATGYGLRVPMTEVVVSSPDREPNLISFRGKRSVPCFMRDIDVGKGYSAAVTVLTESTVDVIVLNAAPVLRVTRELSRRSVT